MSMWGKCTSLGATSIHGQSIDWNAMHRRQSWCENAFMVQCTMKGFPHWQEQKVQRDQREMDMKKFIFMKYRLMSVVMKSGMCEVTVKPRLKEHQWYHEDC